MKEEILRMEGIHSERGGVDLIHGMHLTLYKGETMGLLIHNAYRRSCVASLLCGFLTVNAGRIYYNDQRVDNDAYHDLCMRRIAYVSGSSDLIDGLSVAENIFLIRPAAKTYFVRRKVLTEQAAQLLAYFHTAIDPATPVHRLSPLQRMTIELIKAYARGARIVLLHDLSRTLSPLEFRSLMECVARLKAEGMGVLLADAYWDVLIEYADRLSVYSNGRIIKVFRREEYDAQALSVLLRDVPTQSSGTACTPADSQAISFSHVCTKSLRDVNFTVRPGEILSILDMDGSGNNQIAALLMGECALLFGNITVQGARFTHRTPTHALKRGVGIINENPTRMGLFHDLSVLDNLALPLSSRSPWFFTRRRYMQSLLAQCETLLPARVLAQQNLHSLDEETLQRIVYARWQLLRAKVMVLLRPLSVADARIGQITRECIEELARRGSAVLILSSNAMEARQLGQNILVLQNGRLGPLPPAQDAIN